MHTRQNLAMLSLFSGGDCIQVFTHYAKTLPTELRTFQVGSYSADLDDLEPTLDWPQTYKILLPLPPRCWPQAGANKVLDHKLSTPIVNSCKK